MIVYLYDEMSSLVPRLHSPAFYRTGEWSLGTRLEMSIVPRDACNPPHCKVTAL